MSQAPAVQERPMAMVDAELVESDLAGKRVVLVGPLPPPAGGMANQTRQLAGLLMGEGLEAEVVRTNRPYPTWVARIRGLRALVTEIGFLPRLWRALHRADLVHVMANSWWSFHLFSTTTVRLARWLGKPVVLNYRGGEAAAFFDRQFRWVGSTLEQADRVVVPSDFLKLVFAARGVETTIVPNVIDLERFLPAEQPKKALHILVTRNLEPIYGIDTALRVCAILHEWGLDPHLTVAGEGPHERELRRIASALGIKSRVSFTGRVDNLEIAALYRSARIVLNPSHADNMPISVLEAMACGVPVVSSRVGGVPYLVEDGRTALLVEKEDHLAMAEAVRRLHSDRELYYSIRQAGLEEVRRYQWRSVRTRLFAVYRAILGD